MKRELLYGVLASVILILVMGPNVIWAEDTSSRIYNLENQVDDLETQLQNLNADTLDGFDSPDFATSNHTHTEYGVLSIPAAAFKTVVSGYGLNSYETMYFVTHWGNNPYLNAPVYLPHKAKILSVTFHFIDNDPNLKVWAQLKALQYGVDPQQQQWILASAVTSGAPGFVSLTDATVANPIVDNINFRYWIRTELRSLDLLVQGVVIEYEVTR
jgi:hypothetical protein